MPETFGPHLEASLIGRRHKFPNRKLINIPLPRDRETATTNGIFDDMEATSFPISGQHVDDMMRYMQQITFKKAESHDDVLQWMHKLDELTPEEALKSTADIESISYISAMMLAKIYMHAARNAKAKDSSQDQIEECWRRLYRCYIRAFSLNSADLLFTECVNGLNEDGAVERFPDETARLLEVGIRMKVPGYGHRYEFFDAYFKFQSERGKTAEAFQFVKSHMECFANMALVSSSAFGVIAKKYPEGDLMRMQDISKAGHNFNEILDKNRIGADYVYGVAREYILSYCLAYKGDYAGARRVASIRKLRQLGSSQEWEDIDKNINSLIPNFYEEMDHPMSRELDRIESEIDARRDKTRQEITVATRRRECREAIEKGDVRRGLAVIEASYQNDREDYVIYFNALDIFLGHFANPAHRNPDAIIEALVELFKAEAEGRVRIPLEVKNICMARAAEARFKLRQYQEIIDEHAASAVSGRTILRGETYYVAKACFKKGTDEDVRDGIGIICEALPQFAGTNWEYEIWNQDLLPRYAQYKETIHAAGNNKRAVSVLTEIIRAHPENLAAHVARVEIALNHKEFLDSFVGWVEGMIEAGICDVSLIIKIARKLRGGVKLPEAVAVLKLLPQYEENLEVSTLLCEVLLSPSLLTKKSYQEAFGLAGRHAGLRDSLGAQFVAARERLEMESFEPVSFPVFLGRAIDKHRNSNAVPTDDSISMAIVFGKLRDVAEIQKVEFREFESAGFNLESLQAESVPVCVPLADIFGVERMRFERQDGNFSAICTLKQNGGNKLKREFVTAEFSCEDGLTSADCVEYAAEDEARTKLFIRLFEAAVHEEFLARLGCEGQAGLVEEECRALSSEMQKLRRLIAEYERAKSPFYSEKEGIAGIEERNKMICERIEKALDALSKNPNFPAREELLGLIQRYIEIIKTCRDLDEPVTIYNSAIDHTNPLSRYIKYSRIFSADFARKRLREAKTGEGVLEKFSQSVKNKGNLAGYYELVCYFEDEGESGEVPISVFLDNKGIATIPGINRDNPLYEHLWMLALESLMMKVVPEMGSFTKVFGKKNFQGTDRRSPFLSGNLEDRLSQDFRVSSRRRVCCSALVLAAERSSEESAVPARKVDVLDDICGAFTLVELSEKDITQWPLYIRDGKCFKKVDGLFLRRDDKTYVVAEKLREIFGSETGEISEDAIEITALQEGIREKLLGALRVQVLGGRAYRMPVDFKRPEYEIEIINGEEYFLIPAEYKRGNTVERDGKLFRLKKVQPHTKVDVEGKTYFAVPWQMSDELGEIYKETATIKVDFSPSLVSYAVLYDSATNEILAYTYIGSAKDSRVQDYIEAARRGELCTMKDPKAAQAFQGRQGLKEAVFFVKTNTGYKQGVFPPVWRYLAANRSTHDAAMRLLLDEMKRKVSPADFAKLREKLDNTQPVVAPSHPEKRKKKIIPPELPAIPSPNPVYRMEESPRASQYSGLCGFDLYVVEKGSPLHKALSGVFNLKTGEVLVCIGKPDGRASKVKKEFLVEQKSVEDEE
ncbi:hypothetical protein A3I58_03200 [Candidatus Peregrinibacteria bacterium RIFCSPLOWO2_02_FULL_39_10]|nr:MAG: hypothetical protein A3I58_03200 [Candidatus Peregrinibacteria bacterium RIFCSPLOWO2_02_FULL_39_10]